MSSTHRQVLFERGSEWDGTGKKFRSHYVIRCSTCGDTDSIRFNRYNKSLPPDVIAKQFHSKGWVIGSSRKNDVCPKCVNALTTDRLRRKEITTAEKQKAERDLVIAEGKATPPPPTHPAQSDANLNRRQLLLLDRTSELQRKSAYIQSMLEDLVDRVAVLQKEQAAIVKEIAESKGIGIEQPMKPIEEAMPFEPLPAARRGTRATPADTVLIAHYTRGTSPVTIITISKDLAEQAGLKDRVRLLTGDGEDAGLIKIEPCETGGNKLTAEKNRPILRVASSLLRPASNQMISSIEVKHAVSEGALFVRLPDQFIHAA